jgi:hypothetical protein
MRETWGGDPAQMGERARRTTSVVRGADGLRPWRRQGVPRRTLKPPPSSLMTLPSLSPTPQRLNALPAATPAARRGSTRVTDLRFLLLN